MTTCETCGRTFVSVRRQKVQCCGVPLIVRSHRAPESRLSRLRRHAETSLPICQACEHWVTIDGKTGCDQFAGTLCQSETSILTGAACHHIANPRFRSIDEPQYPSMDQHCVAVTSLSSHPHHLAHQSTCLDSWQRFGLSIVCLNRTTEIATLKTAYPQVAQWIANDDVGTAYDTPTQRIVDLANIATLLDQTVLLINSDIELRGDQQLITEPLSRGEQVVGIRWNYRDQNYKTATREKWGLDAFSFTPELAQSLPRLELSIGRPFFDYWLPYHSRRIGQSMHFIGDRLLFHKTHDLLWSQSDWSRGCEWVCQHYDCDFDTMARDFRRTLPFPPSH